ncbi:MAG: hypothetical protein DSY90_01700 [Deltaproteobacteria bacterium]|nr:MAG: hypothetical protein DSY90_01700 [Deltaproteobacteria bacterium]
MQHFPVFSLQTLVFLIIATEANRYAEQVQEEKGMDSKLHPTTTEEMKLYIAINVMMGIRILPCI